MKNAVTALSVLALGCSSASALSLQSNQALAGASLVSEAVEDSSTYLLYRFAISNDGASQAPIAVVVLDLADPRSDAGSTTAPPATGEYTPLDIGSLPPHPDVVRTDIVPIGPITPADWSASQSSFGTFKWAEDDGFGFRRNSGVDPGSATSGFGLRSPYYPGIRQVEVIPAYRALWDLYPSIRDADAVEDVLSQFNLLISAVLPTWKASELNHSLIDQQLNDACGALGWITNSGICNSLQVKLDEVSQALAANNLVAAAGGLMAFSEELDALGVRFISEEAYWMLKINAEALAAQLG